MDFEYSPEQEAFRAEVRAWLEANFPRELKIDDPMDERIAPNREIFEKRREWQKKLAAAGWVGIDWPKAYGGRAANLMEQVIFDEEYFRVGAPILPSYLGVWLLGPTLMHWGTEEQKKKYLPRILPAADVWCQGYSEPGAGSDLAGLATRAELKGDYFVINGQKVWTSGAQYADRMFLLARTDPDAPKHKGISYLLLDNMHAPGLEVRPLITMNGHHHFNEVFFDNVQIPKENLVGPLNEGWKVAVTTLAFERRIADGGGQAAQVRRLAELARRVRIGGRPAWDHEWVRQDLSQFMIECEAMKYTRLRSLTRQLKGLPPGPEGSTLKLFGSELGVRIARFASELLGPYATMAEPAALVPDAPRWESRLLSSRQYTIAGGTSEVQRNILGERQLGLPK